MIVTIEAPVRKICPYRLEVDHGSATLTFDIAKGDGPELHTLAARLHDTKDRVVSHEEYTRNIMDAWGFRGLVSVETHWHTAGLEITCATSQIPQRSQSATP